VRRKSVPRGWVCSWLSSLAWSAGGMGAEGVGAAQGDLVDLAGSGAWEVGDYVEVFRDLVLRESAEEEFAQLLSTRALSWGWDDEGVADFAPAVVVGGDDGRLGDVGMTEEH